MRVTLLSRAKPRRRTAFPNYSLVLSQKVLLGLEGLVSKHRDRPVRHWMKVKNRKHPAMERVMDDLRYNGHRWMIRWSQTIP
jgi:hypothetical protein